MSPLLLVLVTFLVGSNYSASVEKSDAQQRSGAKTGEEKMAEMASAIEKLSQRLERMEAGWIGDKSQLESRLEKKNQEVEKLESVVETMRKQCENKNEEVANLKKHVASMENRMRTPVANLEKDLNDIKSEKNVKLAGLRDLPYLMVCAFQNDWRSAESVVPYDRITTEYNNANQPGGKDKMMDIIIILIGWQVDADIDGVQCCDKPTYPGGDGSMDIKTGVFTVITSGYYVITYRWF